MYLTGGVGSKPRIFKLSKLKSAGTNVGKKAKDWVATLGAVHPYCRCNLERYDKDREWDSKKRAFSKLKPFESKVKVQVR